MVCPVDGGRSESESVSLLLRSNEIIPFDLLTFLDLGFNRLLATGRDNSTCVQEVFRKINVFVGRSLTVTKRLLKEPESLFSQSAYYHEL